MTLQNFEWVTAILQQIHNKEDLSPADKIEGLIQILESQGNTSQDWSNVLIFSPLSSIKYIKNCTFNGHIVIRQLNGLPVNICIDGEHVDMVTSSGLLNSHFSGNCYLSANVTIRDSCIHNTFIGCNSSILGCGLITHNGSTSNRFLFTKSIKVGPESCGREIHLLPDLPYATICSQALTTLTRDITSEPQTVEINEFLEFVKPLEFLTLIDENVLLFHCMNIKNTIICSNCIFADSKIENCLVLKDSKIRNNVSLKSSTVGIKCQLEGNVLGSNLYMCEYGSVSGSARVGDVIMGPDAEIAGGECQHSIVGPFLGFHHSSLLLATLWPQGRGNLSYAAAVGASHPGRVSDQECHMGEGVFIGLNVLIKFPFNALHAPYSLLSAGTTLSPQNIQYPFSLLITSNNNNNSCTSPKPLICIKPGWGLYGNAYFIERAQMKYSSRRNSRNHCTDFPIMRPYIVYLVLTARDRIRRMFNLESENGSTITGLRTVRQLAGLGECEAAVSDLVKANNAYSSFVQRFALQVIVGEYVKTKTLEAPSPNSTIVSEDICIPIPTSILPVLSDFLDKLQSVREDAENELAVSAFAEDDNNTTSLSLLSTDLLSSFSSTLTSTSYTLLALKIIFHEFKLDISKPSKDFQTPFIYFAKKDFIFLLNKLVELEQEFAGNVLSSRLKDEERGVDIIEDYSKINSFARNNSSDDVTASTQRRVLYYSQILSSLSN